ncbi:ubiquitin-conjugating enzyme E2 Z [Rhipicephalus sanguineus]|uniref:UBC core domain-containing protein n=1 Tax=Rhipicephalus sanguineus TaxID=34632 RepID=A0A9D4PK11_RHISA|nr:ubiquitin-conjugating enzyme E2 Z [Rhipicephalus sanguineus]KAH7943086.1 hypothetical protein HPB52_004912 [Rhipicephalus sanguineus]
MANLLKDFLDSHEEEKPTPQCLMRIQRDLAELHADPPPGVFAAPEESDVSVIHAVIVGPWNTPLEGGLFHIVFKLPPDYPMRSPHAFFVTGVEAMVSFHNHIRWGNICPSAQGTYGGMSWSPAQTIGSLLVSIQSLLADGAAERMRLNAVSIAVCDTLEGCLKELPAPDAMPPPLKKQVLKYFVDNYAKYEDSVKAQIGSSTGPFSWFSGNSCYEQLLQRLRYIKKEVDEKKAADGQQNNDFSLPAVTQSRQA